MQNESLWWRPDTERNIKACYRSCILQRFARQAVWNLVSSQEQVKEIFSYVWCTQLPPSQTRKSMFLLSEVYLILSYRINYFQYRFICHKCLQESTLSIVYYNGCSNLCVNSSPKCRTKLNFIVSKVVIKYWKTRIKLTFRNESISTELIKHILPFMFQ